MPTFQVPDFAPSLQRERIGRKSLVTNMELMENLTHWIVTRLGVVPRVYEPEE
jgi:hypothetical protein